MKKEILQIVRAAALGVVTILLLIITAFELLPGSHSTLTAKDPIKVSPSPVSSGADRYHLLVTGTLFNDSDETVTVDSLTVKVTGADGDFDIQIPLSLTLIPRAEYDLSYSTEGDRSYQYVKSVTAVSNGGELPVSNASKSSFGTVSLLLIALTIIAGYFCYRSVMVCYYARIEKKTMEKKDLNA